MCGRITIHSNMARIIDEFGVSMYGAITIQPRYNLPPTLQVPVIRQTDGKRQLSLMRWGLIPPWVKELKKAPMLNNARADGVADKPSFRSAFKNRRCIIPVDGFYEWETIGKEKLPYYMWLDPDSTDLQYLLQPCPDD